MCNCLKEIDDSLKARNYDIDKSISLAGRDSRAIISISKIDPKRKTFFTLVASFCPFCGEQYDSVKSETK